MLGVNAEQSGKLYDGKNIHVVTDHEGRFVFTVNARSSLLRDVNRKELDIITKNEKFLI